MTHLLPSIHTTPGNSAAALFELSLRFPALPSTGVIGLYSTAMRYSYNSFNLESPAVLFQKDNHVSIRKLSSIVDQVPPSLVEAYATMMETHFVIPLDMHGMGWMISSEDNGVDMRSFYLVRGACAFLDDIHTPENDPDIITDRSLVCLHDSHLSAHEKMERQSHYKGLEAIINTVLSAETPGATYHL